MKFVDEVVIEIIAGKGGDGMISFRREKFVPYGGPSGGDGGRGGSVILEASKDLNTLFELNFHHSYHGEPGGKGMAKDMAGADGKDIRVKVPVGTLVYNSETGDFLADLGKDRTEFIVGKGGRGGRGNARFANSVRRAPRIAEKGEPGDHFKLRLELKLLADVGLIGHPNVGKSTLLSVVSNARPKIADYPFTTLVPNLGIVKPEGMNSFCMADLPGLIEGAHKGTGLGIQFLKHIERTRVLLHLVDLSDQTPTQGLKAFDTVMEELKAFDSTLCERPMLAAATKMDLPEARKRFLKFQKLLQARGLEVLPISGAARTGVDDLLKALAGLLARAPAVNAAPPLSVKTYKFLPPFDIEASGKGHWIVQGSEIERLVQMTDFTTDDGVARFKTKLRAIGFMEALQHCGGVDEDTVAVGGMEFFYWEFFR